VCAGWCGGGGGAVVIGQVMRGSVARQQVSVAEAGITTARDGDVALGADATRQPRAVGSLHAAHCHHVDAVRVASHRREALPSHHHHHHTHMHTDTHTHIQPVTTARAKPPAYFRSRARRPLQSLRTEG